VQVRSCGYGVFTACATAQEATPSPSYPRKAVPAAPPGISTSGDGAGTSWWTDWKTYRITPNICVPRSAVMHSTAALNINPRTHCNVPPKLPPSINYVRRRSDRCPIAGTNRAPAIRKGLEGAETAIVRIWSSPS
jgi:hypothetical protein